MIELLNSAAGSPFAYIRIPVCDGDLDLYGANQCHLGFVSVIKKTKTAHINKNWITLIDRVMKAVYCAIELSCNSKRLGYFSEISFVYR